MPRMLSCLVFLILPLPTLVAQEELFRMSLEELLQTEIVSVSKRTEGILTAPATVDVITAEDIRRRGYTNLEQLLHDLTGIDISRGNGTNYSTFYTRGYRSNNPDRTLVLIDGVEENDLWSGTAWMSRQYAIGNIKRVEVVYGPASTMYGANAFLGVINIITKDADDIIRPGKSFGLLTQAGYGTWNSRYVEATGAGKFNDIKLTITGRVYASDEMNLNGYPDYDYDLTPYDIGYYRDRLSTTSDSLANRARQLDSAVYLGATSSTNGKAPVFADKTLDWLVHGKLEMGDFTLGFQKWQIQEGYGAWYRDEYEMGTANGGQWVPSNMFMYARYAKQLSRKWSLESLSSFRMHQIRPESRSNYFVGYLNGELNADSLMQSVSPRWDVNYWFVHSQQFRTEIKVHYVPSRRWDVVGGGEFRSSLIQGDYIRGATKHPDESGFPIDPIQSGIPGGNHYYYLDYGFYGQASYQPADRWNLSLGGRIDHNDIRSTGGYGTVFNPRAAVVWTPSSFVVKAIYSEAFKDADNFSKFSTIQARRLNNPNLKPERVKNIEGSLAWRVNRHAFVEVSAYRARYSDVIGTVTVPYDSTTTTQHQAIGSLLIKGIQAKAVANYRSYHALMNYTFTNPRNTEDDVRIGDIASHRINMIVGARWFDRLEATLRMNYVGERKTGSGTTIKDNPRNEIKSYSVVHFVIGYGPIVRGLSVQCMVQNLFDREYFDPGVRSADGDYYASRLPQERRNIVLRALFEF